MFFLPSDRRRAANIERLLASLIRKLDHMESRIMTILDDVQAAEDAALAKITANTDALSAVKAALDAQTAKIADLTAQLADAIANGADPAALQAVLDKANAIVAATDTQATAEAALTNTDAQP